MLQLSSFFFDFSCVNELVRFCFYIGLLIICSLDFPSPLYAPRIVGNTASMFYTPSKVLQFIGCSMPSVRILRIIRTFTLVAWIAAAVGGLQPFSGILTFLGFAFLHAANSGALGSNHSTHSALYALFALSFTASPNGFFTLDYHLHQWCHWLPLMSPGSFLESGFSLKLLLVSLVYIMLAGGVAKLRNGGIAWLNGRALRFYIEESIQYARSPWLSRVLRSSPQLCRVLAVLTIVIEVSGLLLLVDVRWTPVVVLAWSCLHVGILLTMMPAYWVQMWCYLLLIDWPKFFGFNSVRFWVAENSHDLLAVEILTAFGLAYCLVLLFVFLCGSEEWPFTSVPMYSNGAPPGERVFPAVSDLHSRAIAALNGDVKAWYRPWVKAEADEDILIVPSNSQLFSRPLFDVLSEHGLQLARWSQWAKVIRSVAISDIASKPPSEPGRIGSDFPAARFLSQLVLFIPKLLPDIARHYSRLDLVCRTSGGPLLIGSAKI